MVHIYRDIEYSFEPTPGFFKFQYTTTRILDFVTVKLFLYVNAPSYRQDAMYRAGYLCQAWSNEEFLYKLEE